MTDLKTEGQYKFIVETRVDETFWTGTEREPRWVTFPRFTKSTASAYWYAQSQVRRMIEADIEAFAASVLSKDEPPIFATIKTLAPDCIAVVYGQPGAVFSDVYSFALVPDTEYVPMGV